MVQATKRRQANVQRVQQLQTAISYIRQQKQISNLDRLIKYMDREHGIGKADTERQLQHAVKDSLILSYTGIGFKGSKTGVEYEGFRVPEPEEIEFEDDGHDWYCFDCHCPGEVVCCSGCWRVYHRNCTLEDTTETTFTCTVCKDIEAGRKKNKTKRKLLNTLLSYTVIRLKEKTRELHRIGHREEEKKYMPFFVYKPMDLNKMEQKVALKQYQTVEEFLSDSKLVYHNVYLIYGDDTKDGMAELARIMIRDCKYDLDEMLQCQNCYYMSNAKPKDWFCQPCEISHELVYAKLKGYSYWPAKVVRYLEDSKYDVRFFGSLHQRALIPKEHIKPIDIGVKELNAKRTSGFVKACEELKLHQELLEEKLLKAEKKKKEGGHDEESEEEDDDEEEIGNMGDKTNGREEDEKSHDAVSSTSQSAKNSNQKVSSPEDSNIVTSSEEYIPPEKKRKMQIIMATIGVQTSKKTSNSASKIATTQTDSSDTTSNKTCDCDNKYNKIFNDFKERLETDHRDSKDKALKELAERLQRDFEEDKQQAVSRAMGKLQQELEKVRRQTEEKCKEQYMEEMKKLAQKHKEAISATKKKQWCYNCEEEAMYHCCWNTSYCSVKCQQEHWHKEHKRVCRRKR